MSGLEAIADNRAISELTSRYGRKRVEHTLQALGRKYQFSAALNSDVGELLLRDMMEMWDELLPKVVDQNATDQEKVQFQVVNTLLVRWAKRISEVLALRPTK